MILSYILSKSEEKLQGQELAVSLPVREMVQITIQNYRRSLQEFSESPIMSRCNSLGSSRSLPGAPQSMTEWLVLWEKDPVEILLDLGFGTEEPDVCTKIPPRFFSGTSIAKGINIRVFLEAQRQQMDIERPNLYERFRQLEILDHVTSAFSSLLTDVNTQQTKAQDTAGDQMSLLDAAKSRPAVTRAKWRTICQLLKRASRQTSLLKKGLLAPEEATLSGKKEQPPFCANIAESGRVQVGISACVRLGSLTQEQPPGEKDDSAYPTSHCPPTPLGKTWTSSDPVAKQPNFSPVCEAPVKDRPTKESPLLVAHMLKKVSDLNCKLPDSFEMEEIQSFEDENPCGNAPDTTSEAKLTRTSSCQSDSSGFMEELPELVGLQNSSLSGKISCISNIPNQETGLSNRTVFSMLNQDFQQKPDDCVAKGFNTVCESILAVPGSTKVCSDQEEETHLLLTAENGKYQAYNAEPQTFEQEMLCDMDKEEDKTGRKQLEKEEGINEQSPCFQDDTQDEGDPSSPKLDDNAYFSTEHIKVDVSSTELNAINPAVINGTKIRGEDEGDMCLTGKDTGFVCHESAHRGCTEHVKGQWWGVEVVSKDGTLLAVNEVKNRQEFCKVEEDPKNTRRFPRTGLPETPWWGSAVQNGSSATSRCSLPISQKHPSCLAEGPGLRSSEGQETGSVGEVSCVNKSEQGDAVQNCEIASAHLKSVTVQMSSRLEFNSRVKCTGQDTPVSLAREDLVDFSDMLVHHSETRPLIWSDPGASKDGVKQTSEASSQTDTHAKKPRWLPLLHPPHSHLTKSASLDSILCGQHRSRYWGEAPGAGDVQGSCCCHCCCCHCCCPWTCPMGVSPHCPVGCCSNHASTKLQLLKTLMLLQDTAMDDLAPCTLHEIEAMKSSCQHFQEKLDEIEQHLTEQQLLFSSAMSDEGREEARHLQLLRQAVHQEVAELEFQLNDQACQIREGILMQLDQLLIEQSHLFSELGLSDLKGERKDLNNQAFPDAADTSDLQRGCSKMMLQRGPGKNTSNRLIPCPASRGTPSAVSYQDTT